jgi:TRAP-type transport system small permease protein
MLAMKRMDAVLMTALSWVLIVLLAGMAAVVFANVTMRYVTGGSLVWAEEIARYAMVWLTFLGAGPVLRMGGHIAIENLQDALPQVAAQWIRAGVALAMAGLGVGMVWMGVQYMLRSQFQMTASTQIPFSYVYAAIPVGGALLLWSTLAIAAGYVRSRTFEADANASQHQEGVQV